MKKLSMDELNRKTVEDFKASEKRKIIIILDNIRSMHNVGSVFRTSDAFLIEAIYLCGFTPTPPHREINKTALGATETVSWKYFNSTIEAIEYSKSIGYDVFAVEQVDKSISLEKFNYINPTAIVLGNEVDGVDEAVLPMVNGCIEIPQMGMKHSLNVSVATGIVLWQLIWVK